VGKAQEIRQLWSATRQEKLLAETLDCVGDSHLALKKTKNPPARRLTPQAPAIPPDGHLSGLRWSEVLLDLVVQRGAGCKNLQ
jgi:hypothetical protein